MMNQYNAQFTQYSQPISSTPTITMSTSIGQGFNNQGFNSQGFNSQGFNNQGFNNQKSMTSMASNGHSSMAFVSEMQEK